MNKLSQIKTDIKWNGDAAITILFDEEEGEILTRIILSLSKKLKSILKEQLIESIPAYQSLTLSFDILKIDIDEIENSIKQAIENIQDEDVNFDSSKLVEIPVCYQEAYAPDLASLAKHCNLTSDEVIRLHTKTEYLVNMLGFLPGFPYLTGLNKKLNCPRKEVPSLKVPAGAVGIGGGQTGIYPVESPGGWNIIGRTPASIFNSSEESPFIVQPLDRIRFIPIDVEEYELLIKERK